MSERDALLGVLGLAFVGWLSAAVLLSKWDRAKERIEILERALDYERAVRWAREKEQLAGRIKESWQDRFGRTDEQPDPDESGQQAYSRLLISDLLRGTGPQVIVWERGDNEQGDEGDGLRGEW